MQSYPLQEIQYGEKQGEFCAGIANIHPETANLAANKERMLTALEIFSRKKMNMAVFPEYCLSGLFDTPESTPLEYMHTATLDSLAPWLEKHVVPFINDTLQYIIINGLVADEAKRLYNTTAVIDASGFCLAPEKTYRKTFLPGLEKNNVTSGLTDWLVLDTPYGRTGFVTCYDICFPQCMTDLVYTHEIDMLVVTAAWRRQGKRDYPGLGIQEENFYQFQWKTLLPALATQYQVWVLAANGVGPRNPHTFDYCGLSGIWAPSGINIALASDRTEELLLVSNMEIQHDLARERDAFGCVNDFTAIQEALKSRSTDL